MLAIGATLIATAFLLAAMFFTVVPILPGTLFTIPAFLIYGLMAGWDHFSIWFWIGQIVLMVVNFLSDNVAQIFGIKKMGGSKAGMIGGSVGMFVLPLVISPLGPLAVIFGPLLGAVIGAMVGEMLMRRKSNEVMKVGWGSLLSFLAGTVFKILLVGVQIIWFYLAIF
ncbi:DUF456 domain-containing protein [Tumebacillus flagellatus]|uniref:DUF456 domain-containing protein n=1 Tax=Tumebacillus flagellatus TaxID=1157490 RepID=A0A074LSK9_9BACL|nr:DUF456 domain-containing protein [Tumebacillus flagellatus]KEO83480.1 hypothetical protein EL26_09695 [Tumebacillus flagellatus]